MNKLDATGESLESILASIRRSLAEQSTDVLADDSAPPPVSLEPPEADAPDDEAPPRFLSNGNGGMDAPRPLEVPIRHEPTFAALEDPPPPAPLSAALLRLEDDAPPPPPAAVTAPPQPQEGSQDPLWFLTRPGAKDSVPAPMPSAASAQPAGVVQSLAAAPKPALNEIVRGPLPPFFGSSPEAANVEVAPAPPMPTPPMPTPPMPTPPMPTSSTPMPLAAGAVIPPPPAAILRPSEGAPPRGGAQDSPPRLSAEPVGAAGPARAAGGAMREGAPGAKAHSVPAQPAAATGATQLQGLDAMVADLLRPMLRRWLDENMPRLVSAALKAEAENPPRRDPKKS